MMTLRTAALSPIPTLADLREQVLQRSSTRCPRWRFRLADDLIMQLQPKPCVLRFPRPAGYTGSWRQMIVRFDGVAHCALVGHADASMLVEKPNWNAVPQMRVKFLLAAYADAPAEWTLVYTGGRWSRGLAWPEVRRQIWERLVVAFGNGAFDRFTPDLMLSAHCLMCGRALTDPASMARLVGPECSGSGSLTVPGLLAASGAGA